MRQSLKSTGHLCVITLMVVATVGLASASPILSTTSTVGGAPLADFEGFAEGTLISSQYPGVTFSQDDGGTPMIDDFPFLFGYHAVSGTGVLTGSQNGGAQFPTVAGLVINFLTPVSTVEWFLSDMSPLGFKTINAFGAGNVLLESYIATSERYVGFTRVTADIVRVSFDSSVSNDAFAIDDVRIVAATVPEPASIFTIVTAVAGLAAMTRRRTKKQIM